MLSSQIGEAQLSIPCLRKLKESRCTDVALMASAAVLAIIGCLALAGVLNFIGTTHAAYLAYGMYAGAGILFVAEITKVVLDRCSKHPQHNYPVPRDYKSPAIACSDPLSQIEIQNLKEQANQYAQEHHSAFSGKFVPVGGDSTGYTVEEPTAKEKRIAQQNLFNYLAAIIDHHEFQKDPIAFMEAWQIQRGNTEELRYPEDTARDFFMEAVGKI